MYEYRATVVNVIDGDTIDVDIDLGFFITKRERVRFAEIDVYEIKIGKDTTEEQKQIGLAAKAYVENLLLNRQVLLKTIKINSSDKYGRFLALVFLLEEDKEIKVNDLLIKEGFVKQA